MLSRDAARIANIFKSRWGHWEAPGWPTDCPLKEAGVYTGFIGTAEAWIRDIATLDFYYERFSDASAHLMSVDMETAAVFALSEAYGIRRRLAVRCISDNDRREPHLNEMSEIIPATTAAAERANDVLVQLMLKILQDEH
jgi:nucleoside phosphorylase